ncbi:unnamed protein product [Nippostrongylus brasiliensis]|uniref:ANK_REP_REGION domain-containing protein n=1 Tax=Nippostrongylus brasiliensis TaxID=27835 RepID=A0A0N4YJJ7_NIPBR|nr:unnamed protein product [Nippostrongylus brasiliensis]
MATVIGEHLQLTCSSKGIGIFCLKYDVRLREKQFLLSCERGDIGSVRKLLAIKDGLNINCVDPLGRFKYVFCLSILVYLLDTVGLVKVEHSFLIATDQSQ